MSLIKFMMQRSEENNSNSGRWVSDGKTTIVEFDMPQQPDIKENEMDIFQLMSFFKRDKNDTSKHG